MSVGFGMAWDVKGDWGRVWERWAVKEDMSGLREGRGGLEAGVMLCSTSEG